MTGRGRAAAALAVLALLVLAACGPSAESGVQQPSTGPASPAPGGAGVEGSEGGVLLLSGVIDLDAETATLGAARRLPGRGQVEPDDGGPFRLALEGEDGEEVLAVDFEPPEPSPESDGEVVTHFDVRVREPLPPLTRATVSHRGQLLGSRDAGPSVPTVRILSPPDGEDVAYRDATFAWEGDDEDGDDLVYSVLLSTDGGQTWRSLGAGTDRTELTVDAGSHALERSGDARLLVSVSDGLNSTWVESPPFRIR